MTYQVEEVEHKKERNIVIRLKGEDVSFQASAYGVSVYLDEKTAGSIWFHLGVILQEREKKKRAKELA